MHFFIARLGGGGLGPFDLLFLGLAAVIVYPDEVLDWLSQKTGKIFGFTAMLVLEAVAIGIIITTVALFAPTDPRLYWWSPLLAVGMLACFRGLKAAITRLLGFPPE